MEAGLDAIRKIEVFTAGTKDADEFYAEEMIFDACLMNFVVLGEVVTKVSPETQERYSDIAWTQIKGFRNVLAHAYFGVDAEEVWQIIQHELPVLKARFKQILLEV